MEWIQIKAGFEAEDVWLAEELISDIFFTLGVKGVVCNTPLPDPDDGFNRPSVPLTKNSIVGYIPKTDTSPSLLQTIEEKTKALEKKGIRISVTTQTIDQEQWSESWKRFFFPVKITDRIVIKPAWRDYTPDPGDIIIDIDPGMAFGTGTHDTTSMCIAMIEKYLKTGDSFLDVGTGSGILMITAAKLGAGRITGIDNDDIAVAAARENLDKNRIQRDHYQVFHHTIERLANEKYDIVAANILAAVIIDMLPEIKKRVSSRGRVILSGIITEQKEKVISELEKNGFSSVKVTTSGEWVALSAQPV